jgi:hypothetical protein
MPIKSTNVLTAIHSAKDLTRGITTPSHNWPKHPPLLRSTFSPHPELDEIRLQFPPNAVKKIITNPSPNSPSAANSLHTTLYHCFPTTDQLS